MELIVAVTADYYRRIARERVEAGSTVVEIGCSTGRTTHLLAGRYSQVVAVDVSEEMVARVQRELADCDNVLVARFDGRDVDKLAELAGRPDAVFIDVGGDALLENVLTILWLCLRGLRPQRRLVVRSRSLALLMGLVTEVETRPFQEEAVALPKPAPLESLLELSHSSHIGNRIFAARRLRAIHCSEAQQRLQEMLTDPCGKVRYIVRLHLQCGKDQEKRKGVAQ